MTQHRFYESYESTKSMKGMNPGDNSVPLDAGKGSFCRKYDSSARYTGGREYNPDSRCDISKRYN